MNPSSDEEANSAQEIKNKTASIIVISECIKDSLPRK